ncbi:hypothetical protein [Paraburkholderia bannensis]|uniref:hypothetical protein n=1 Tax=Paraburkholderia bannensis TaxID=765414 RepID=UPI002AC37214|nr:hypothetical protein [Paraburkholderia bannensis]
MVVLSSSVLTQQRPESHGAGDVRVFKFSTVVDWIELRVKLDRDAEGVATNGGTLYRLLNADKLRVSYAKPVNPGAGGAATEYLVRIQEPGNISDVRAVVDRIGAYRPFLEAPAIAAIEIAFDARPKVVGDVISLNAMTVRLMKSIMPPVRSWRNSRVWIPPSERDLISDATDSLLTARPDLTPTRTLYIGVRVAGHKNEDYVQDRLIQRFELRRLEENVLARRPRSPFEIALDDVQWRVYRKVRDEQFDNEGARLQETSLTVEEHRARAEVTLCGQILHDLNLTTIDDLARFDFAAIAQRKLLRFSKVTSIPRYPDLFRQKVIVEGMKIDEHSPACIIGPMNLRDRKGRPLMVSPFITLDNDLNGLLQKRLKRLTRNFQRT